MHPDPTVPDGETATLDRARDTGGTRHPPSKTAGAAAGAIIVLLFAVVHDVLISDIWFNVVSMVIAGALCGFCIVWSYSSAVAEYSMRRRFVSSLL